MKRVLALIMAMASMITLLNCTPIYAEDAVALTQDQEAVLDYVGIYDKEADLTENITKAEFATMLSKVAFGLDANLEALASGKGAKDVSEAMDYYYAVTALLSSGHISTNKYGNFLPEQEIDIETAYEFLLRTMGYAKTDMFIAGKYSKLLAQKDVTDGLVSTSGKGLSRVNAYILIYNMLNADVADMMNSDYNMSTNKEVLFREARLNLFKTTGIVMDDGITALTGETAINENEIIIGNGSTMENKTGLGNLVGKYVVAYFTEEGDQDSVVFLYERADKNALLVIEGINIIDFDTTKATVNEYVYYDDEFSSKQQKVKVKKNATIIYNDKALTLTDQFTEDMFIPETGIVRLFDNTSDGIMDIIRIEDYRAVVATGADITLNRAYLKVGGEVLDLDSVSYKMYNAKGEETDLTAINGETVLSVMESLDGQRVKILVSSDIQSGTVNSLSQSTSSVRGYITTEEGGKYSFSSYLDTNYGAPEVAGRYDFYLDAFGKLVAYEKIAGPYDWMFGYIQWTKSISDKAGQLYIRLFNDIGDWEMLPVARKLYVLDEQDNENNWSQAQIVSALGILNDADDTNDASVDAAIRNYLAYEGIMRYKLNSNGEVIKVELPMYFGTRPSRPDRLWCMIDTVSTEDTVTNYEDRIYGTNEQYEVGKSGTKAVVGGQAAITSAAKLISVPLVRTRNDEYKIISVDLLDDSLGSNSTTQALMLYNTDYRSVFAEIAIMTSAVQGGTGQLHEQRMMYVRSVRKVADPDTGEPCYEITVMNVSGKEVAYLMEEETYLTGVLGASNGHISDGDGDGINDAIVHLGPGDGIYYAVEGGYLKDAMVFYDADQMVYDTNVTQEEIDAGTAQKTIKGGIPGIERLTYENGALSNPFAVNGGSGATYYQGDFAPLANAHLFNPGAMKVFIGWVYDVQDGVATITNQNPAHGIDRSLNESDGVAWETNIFTNVFTYPEMGRVQNVANVTRATAANVMRPYTKYGAACSKVVYTKRVYAGESMCVINPQ